MNLKKEKTNKVSFDSSLVSLWFHLSPLWFHFCVKPYETVSILSTVAMQCVLIGSEYPVMDTLLFCTPNTTRSVRHLRHKKHTSIRCKRRPLPSFSFPSRIHFSKSICCSRRCSVCPSAPRHIPDAALPRHAAALLRPAKRRRARPRLARRHPARRKKPRPPPAAAWRRW